MPESTCAHKDLDWDLADPSVGIFGDAVWCNTCGAEALEVTEDEEDGYRTFNVTKWGEPEPVEG